MAGWTVRNVRWAGIRLHHLLALARALPQAHALRVVMPAMYGYKNVNWVERIELVAHSRDRFWEKLGYDADAWVGHPNGA